MKELGFPLAIKPATGSLERQSGFMPMLLRREEETGVEFDVFDGSMVKELMGDDYEARFERSASFRWGGDEDEMLCALCASAALARLVNGVVLEEGEGRLLSHGEAIDYARQHLPPATTPGPKLRGTRPADIKRYLKPLLDQRSDLVLVGRRLFIRPVRHLLRGAFLDPTGDKYSFRIWRCIMPLWMHPDGIGFGNDRFGILWKVWKPHFEPLLLDSLKEDVFERVGQVTSIDGFDYEDPLGRRPMEMLTRLVLAGAWERAEEFVRQTEHGKARDDYKRQFMEHWESLRSDIDGVCARLHAREAETVKALKLEAIWEPSPFPVEVPAAERAARTAEAPFVTTPWVPRPPGLLQEAPQHPGEIRYAKEYLYRNVDYRNGDPRNGDLMLVVPLTAEAAMERHREREDYVLATRLPDGILLVITRDCHGDRDAEPYEQYPVRSPHASFRIRLHTSSHIITAYASPDYGDTDTIRLSSIHVDDRAERFVNWICHLDDDEKTIHNSLNGPNVYTNTAMTAAERELATCPAPAFGDCAALGERVRSLLRVAGFGEVR
jgi:hypothetical protein